MRSRVGRAPLEPTKESIWPIGHPLLSTGRRSTLRDGSLGRRSWPGLWAFTAGGVFVQCHPKTTPSLPRMFARPKVSWRETPRVSFGSFSAVDGDVQRSAGLDQPGGSQRADAIDQVGLWYDAQVVEACGALCRHPVVGPERDLRRDVPDRAGHRGSKYAVQYRDGRCPRHDQERAATQVLDLAPPHFSATRLAHHGSSAMASRSEATAASFSTAVGGVRW